MFLEAYNTTFILYKNRRIVWDRGRTFNYIVAPQNMNLIFMIGEKSEVASERNLFNFSCRISDRKILTNSIIKLSAPDTVAILHLLLEKKTHLIKKNTFPFFEQIVGNALINIFVCTARIISDS